MKNIILTIVFACLSIYSFAADLEYKLINGDFTNNRTFYEFDIAILTNVSGTRLGDGIVYLDYSTLCFGKNIVENNKIQIIRAANVNLVDKQNAGAYIYTLNGKNASGFNDNTSSRVAFAWTIPNPLNAEVISSFLVVLAHAKIAVFDDTKTPDICLVNLLMDGESFSGSNAKLSTTATTCLINILPVELTDFQGYNIQNANIVYWNTASELNSSHFELERSEDEVNFVSIAKIKANGTTSMPSNYEYKDHFPVNGVNYYRLKIVDLDGTGTNSSIISVKTEEMNLQLVASPNPTQDFLKLTYQAQDKGTIHYKIYNQMGKMVKGGEIEIVTGQHETILDLSDLSSGWYSLRVLGIFDNKAKNEVINIPFTKE